MTEAKTTTRKPKAAAKPAAKKAAPVKTEAPKTETITDTPKDTIMDMTKFDMPEAFKNMFDANNETFKKSVENAKTVATEATDNVETAASSFFKSSEELSTKAMDIFKANTEAAFAQSRKLMGVASPAEAFELSTSYARETVETGMAQAKDYSEAVQATAQTAFEPIKEGFEKAVASVSAK